MRKLIIYQIDAFTNELFKGNPAAVCILDHWLEDELMQSIASENNLAETAFVVPLGNNYQIRWFTPNIEVDLCGHATLASAYVLFNVIKYDGTEIIFHSPRSGLLKVKKSGNNLLLDFPTDKIILYNEMSDNISGCIGIKPIEIYKGKTDYIAIVEDEKAVQNLIPDFSKISKLDARGLIITAKGDEVDFVSRFFGPQSGIDEDPVTGSAHTSLIPIWTGKLGKKKMEAKQLSKRGGHLSCEYKGDRCVIGGQARLFMVGEIFIS